MKRKIKDDVFRTIFKEKKYLKELYYDISGEKLEEKDIKILELKTSVISAVRNDISFIKKDGSAIILMEHQSSNSYNMDIRLLVYYVHLLEQYINKKYKEGLHHYKKIEIPKAEFYVLFNGNATMYDEEKYKTVITIGNRKIDLNTKFISIKYDDLEEDVKQRKDALSAYAYLMKWYYKKLNKEKENYRQVNATQELTKDILEEISHKVFTEVLEKCKEENLYLEIFNREEFNIMRRLTYEEELQLRYDAGVYYGGQEAREQGIKIGEARGKLLGISENKLHIAKNMFKLGLDKETVKKATQLSEEEIRGLMN